MLVAENERMQDASEMCQEQALGVLWSLALAWRVYKRQYNEVWCLWLFSHEHEVAVVKDMVLLEDLYTPTPVKRVAFSCIVL